MARYFIVILLALLTIHTQAQQCGGKRYQERVFAQSYKTSNVVYGNAPSLPPTVYLGESVTQNVDLTLDVYEPFGDTLQRRPLVILAFGGAFLIGSKDDEDIQSVSDSLARKGYVTSCINYRLGMNVADAVSAERAIYRSLQDFSAAVRYFKQHADQYRIDTNYIYVGGVSAGGFAALHMALVDESDRPASTFGASGLNPRPDLGCKDCSGNNYAHSSDVRGVINYWGAIGDVNWIKPSKAKPLVSFHGDQDLIVPYNTGYPFTAMAQLPQVSGSGAIKQRYDQLGAYNEHYKFEGVGHNIWALIVMNQMTPGPTQYYLPIYEATSKFLFGQTRPEKPVVQGVSTVCAGETAIYNIVPQPNLRYCWDINGGQIVSQNGAQIQVRWASGFGGSIMVRTINHLDAVSETDTLTVAILPKPLAAITTPQGTEVCSGGSLPFVSHFQALQYQWLPANYFASANDSASLLDPIISGLYFLQVSDSNGCVGRDSVYVTVLPAPVSPMISQTGDSLVATAGNGDLVWYVNDSMVVGHGTIVVASQNGLYTLVETAPNGCATSSAAYQYVGTGVKGNHTDLLSIYPNPFTDKVVVSGPSTNGTFVLLDITGRQVFSSEVSGTANIELGHLPTGAYFYQFASPIGNRFGLLIKKQ